MQRAILKIIKKIYFILSHKEPAFGRNWKMFSNKIYANDLIYEYLVSEKPCMIARFGSTEMLCLTNYLGVKNKEVKRIDFIKGKSLMWWWEPGTINQLQICAGFFPANVENVEKFCEIMLNAIPEVDILGSWLKEETYFTKQLTNSKRVVLEDIEPFFTSNPWTRALEGKKVLVVHPFAETIERQFQKKELIFEDGLLPNFELKTLKAVQSIAGEHTEFADWFEALEWMKMQIDKIDYDICILGCGAYGFPLAAHIKGKGKKAVHLAGVTQLLFGIKGKRWEEFIVWPYKNLFNSHWVRPGQTETPSNAVKVEGACYW
jgi:hypothetical protein